MVSTSAFRETLVLILFGIVLVPIAAKRAHDAPGYWQTFSREISSLASYGSSADETTLWTSSLAMSLNDTIAYPPAPPPSTRSQRKSAEQQKQQHLPRHARAKQDAAKPVLAVQRSASRSSSGAPEVERAATTIRFQMATSEQETGVETVTARPSRESAAAAARSTPAPAPAPRTAASTSSSASAEPAAVAEPPTIAKESEASKGRWTLIWMCSAIAAVAVFMSSC